jgi:hypothetical protein
MSMLPQMTTIVQIIPSGCDDREALDVVPEVVVAASVCGSTDAVFGLDRRQCRGGCQGRQRIAQWRSSGDAPAPCSQVAGLVRQQEIECRRLGL